MESTQPPPQPPKPRLERLRGDRAVAGVASGLARYLNVDVAWVRIAFVVAALFGGTGLLMYIVGWIAMPEEGETESIATDQARRLPNIGNWIGIALLALAAMIIVGNTGMIDGDILFAGVLVVLGFLLYRGDLGSFVGDRDSESTPPEPATPPSYPDAPEPMTSSLVESEPTVAQPAVEDEVLPPYAPPAPPAPPDPAFEPRPPKPPREPSALGRLVMATLLIVIGIMGVGHSSGWWDPAIRHYVGAGFVVLGAGLVIGSIYGRARWLIPVGLIAAPMLFGAALLNVPLEGGFGDPRFDIESGSELDSEYRLVGGQMILDLTDLEIGADEIYDIDASVVFGSLQIRVPEGLGVEVEAEIDAGEISVNGDAVAQGVSHERSIAYAGEGLIKFDAHVGFGELAVFRVEESP